MAAAEAMAQRRWAALHENLKPQNWHLPNDGETVYTSLTNDEPDRDIFEERAAEIVSGTQPDEHAPE